MSAPVDLPEDTDGAKASDVSKPGHAIPALWFDAQGCGPSDLALQLHPFASEMDGAIPAKLGLRIRAGSVPHGGALIYGAAGPLVDSGFLLCREQVVDLHRQVGEWMIVNPVPSQAEGEAVLHDFYRRFGTGTVSLKAASAALTALTEERDSLRAHVEAQDARIRGLEATIAGKVQP